MDNEKNNKKGNRFKNNPMPYTGFNWWKIIIGFFLIWVIVSYFTQNFNDNPRADISYSAFKKEVAGKNVSEVTFTGNQIMGKFQNKYIQISSGDTSSFNYFSTVKPGIEDPELMEVLEKNNVTVNAEEESDSNWLMYFIFLFLPWVFIIGYFIYMRKKIKGQTGNMMGGGFFGVGKSKAKKYSKEKVSVNFDDVAGLDNAKKDLQEIIDYLKEPEKFSTLGADIPKGVLLMGPPGTGKTLLAKATAGEADVSFFSISGSEFIEMFVGVGASRVRDMFENAKKESPAVIFIDELDSVGRARGTGVGGGHDEREQTLNQILSEMDGFEPNESVVVMAATNRPDVLDSALTRPGRFDRRITLELPHKKAREKILEIHTRNVPLADDINLENLSARTVSFSGADLKNLVNEAALLAGRKKKKKVEQEDFDEARDKILLGAKREEIITEEEKKVIAYHEAGHALIAKLLPDTDPLQKVTIIPRGQSLGATEQLPEIERHNLKRNYLLDRITVTLGGRSSEKLVFEDYTNGAQNDLKVVTQLARKMVCQWGMSDRLGPVTFKQGEEHMFLGKEMAQQKDFSDYTAKVIDEEIEKIIKDMEKRSEKILKENRVKLDALAEALLENETLENNQIDWILDKVSNNGSGKKEDEKINTYGG